MLTAEWNTNQGDGDFTRERHELSDLSFSKVTDMIKAASAEIEKRRGS